MKRYVIQSAICLILISVFVSCSTSKRVTNDSGKYNKSNSGFYKKHSEIYGIQFKGNENKNLLLAIDGWLGSGYKYGGCSKTGTDCSCLVKNIYKQVYEIELNRTTNGIYQQVKHISRNNLKEGDILFFKINGKTISHVGLYIKNDKFVHASSSRGVVISDLNQDYYKKRFFTGGRIKI